MSSVLDESVDRLVDLVAPELEALDPKGSHARDDVTIEALNIVCAFVASDGRYTDEELWAIIQCFGPRVGGSLAGATPQHLRAGYLDDKEKWLDNPSALFEVLVAADRARSTSLAWAYYDCAIKLAHAVCALDFVPSAIEISTIERFRATLMTRLAPRGSTQPAPTATPLATPAAAAPPVPDETLDDVLAELDALVGLDAVKHEVRLVTNLLQVQKLRREHKLPVADGSHHLVFTGNPGTGKTTVARLLARIYRLLGVVKKGQLVETDRAGLVVGFVGQTATKVTAVFESAVGGVLLIDEAYALARGNETDFGREAIDTLVKLIEDHRSDVVVVAAGYPDEMNEFIEANPGLRSRFPKTIAFPDYTTDQLVEIFQSLCKASVYVCDSGATAAVRAFFDAQPRTKGFGNGRLARNLFEAAVANQASRIVKIDAPTDDQLMALTSDDVHGSSDPQPPPSNVVT